MYLVSIFHGIFIEKNKFALNVLLLKCAECRPLGGLHNLKGVAETYLTHSKLFMMKLLRKNTKVAFLKKAPS